MKVDKLPISFKHSDDNRCERLVDSTGVGNFRGDIRRCGRMAVYKVDALCLCSQHAGHAALWDKLSENE